ncbi:MAG TPA: tetratricopeptide repeat protein, partial [Armatimonadota bacterium]|nr:tetratricopeptide repeat protein [Armatimonadota bacterium]
YAAAIRIDSGIFDAHLGHGIALYSQGKHEPARDALQRATTLRDDSFEAWYNLGLSADALGDLPLAETAYSTASPLNDADPACLNNLGVVIYKQDRPCDAIEHFRAAMAADDSYVKAFINLGLALEGCGEDETEALEHWRATVEKFPREASAHCGLANALYRKGEVNQALPEYLQCLQYDTNNVEAHNNVGLIYMERDQLDEALAHFRQGLAQDANYVPALNNLGVLYEKQGKIEEAKAQYKKAIEVDPNYEKAKENLRRLEDN